MHGSTPIVPPGGTIGLIGGGHMARLAALAARALGYKVRVLAPPGDEGCAGVADAVLHARLDDADAAAALARDCDVVTAVAEHASTAALQAAAAFAPVRPDPVVTGVAADRALERRWLASRGFTLGPWKEARDEAQLLRAFVELETPCYVKPRLRADEAHRPILVTSAEQASSAWQALGRRPCVVESVLDVDRELCVLVARTPSGEDVTFPPAVGHRSRTELLWSAIPDDLPESLSAKAQSLAGYVARRLRIEGLLAVELFLLRDGRLVVNELVAGPHDAYHVAEAACATSQAEQLVRAVCGLPLGATDAQRPAAAAFITGELWRDGRAPRFEEALEVSGVRLVLYGRAPEAGRKMGHYLATGPTAAEASDRVLRARRGVMGAARR